MHQNPRFHTVAICSVFAAILVACCAAAQDKNVPVLPVVYQRQEDRTLCQSAAVSMFLKYTARRDVSQKEIKTSLVKLGGQYLHSTRVKLLQSYLPGHEIAFTQSRPERSTPYLLQSYLPGHEIAFRYIADENTAWKEIGDLLRGNMPVILSTRLTPSGHVVLAIGTAETNGERRLIVHDPWGRFNFQTRKYDAKDGTQVSYSFAEFLNRIRLVRGASKGTAVDFQEWYCTGSRQWLMDKKKRAEYPDARVVEEKSDWRYIRCRALPRDLGN